MPRDRSNLYYLGVGCLIAAILIAGGLAAFLFVTYRWGRGVEEAMKDPDVRRQRALDVLGGDDLPDGYHAMVGLRVPFLMETAILTDEPPRSGEDLPDLGERGLIYFAFRDFGRDRQDLEGFFAGETSDPEVLERHDIDVDLGERLASGRIERPSGSIPWVAHRGEITSLQTRGRHDGLVTLFLVHCPDDDYNRVGLWFGPAPAPAGDTAVGDGGPGPAGTVADPAEVEAFVGYFRFCPL